METISLLFFFLDNYSAVSMNKVLVKVYEETEAHIFGNWEYKHNYISAN